MSDAIVSWAATFADGWNPRLSPDGKFVICGSGHASVTDLATKQTKVLAGAPQIMANGWLNPTQAVVSADPSGTDKQWKLMRVDAPYFGTLVPIGPSLNFNGCGANVWAGGETQHIWRGDPDGHTQLLYPLPGDPVPGYAATVDADDGTVVGSVTVHTHPLLKVWRNGLLLRTIEPAYPPNRFLVGGGGYVGYGYYGPSWLNTPDNRNLEVGVTPDRAESPALAFRHQGQVWLVTTADRGLYLRPLGVRDRAITVPVPATDCSVVSLGTQFIVASCDDKGHLTVSWVPASLALLPVVGPTPPPVITPEPPVTTRATIASWETPVNVGQPSRAVAKVLSGKPGQFRWSWGDRTGAWHVGALNVGTDLDHSFNRENKPFDNVLPGPGKYPLRLETLVGGKVVDVTGTPRLLEILAGEVPPVEPPVEPPIEPPVEPPIEPPPDGKPVYDSFVLSESPAVAATFQEVEGRPPGPSDMGHNSYRRLAEGWTAANVQRGLHDPGLSAGGPPWFGWVPVDYDTFVTKESPEVAHAYGQPTPADMGHTAWRRFAEFWTHRDILHSIKGEPLEDGGAGGQTPPRPPGTQRAGLVRADGKRHFADDAGRFWPLGETLFWAMHGWKFERDRLKQNIDYVAGFDFDYLRILAQVGWVGNEISESWSDHVQILDELLDYAWSKGLRLQVTCIGGGGNFNPDQVITNVITAAAARAAAVHSLEVANEWFATFNNESKMKQLGDRLSSSLPHLVALSSPQADEAATANKNWVPAHGSLGMAHMDRTDNTNEWKFRHCRKPYEASGPPGSDSPGIQSSHNEPGGPRSSVAEFPEAIHNAMQRATAIVCGWEDYCFHNGAGVYGQVDTAHNRPPNLWEVPGIDECMKAVRGVDKLIPGWCSDGALTRGGYDSNGNYAPVGPHPLAADVYWPTANADHGVVRDYARVNGDQFCQVLIGLKDHVNMKARVNYNVNVSDPITGQSTQFSVHAGESHRIDPVSRDSQGFGGLILAGTQF